MPGGVESLQDIWLALIIFFRINEAGIRRTLFSNDLVKSLSVPTSMIDIHVTMLGVYLIIAGFLIRDQMVKLLAGMVCKSTSWYDLGVSRKESISSI